MRIGSCLGAAAVLLVGVASPAHADSAPAVGDDCTHAQMNTVTTSTAGTAVRCMSVAYDGFHWLPDPGHLQPDPSIAGRAGWDACMSVPTNTPADCRCLVDGHC